MLSPYARTTNWTIDELIARAMTLDGWPISSGGGGADEISLLSEDIAHGGSRHSIVASPRSGGPGPPATTPEEHSSSWDSVRRAGTYRRRGVGQLHVSREGRAAARPVGLPTYTRRSVQLCLGAAASGMPLGRKVQAPSALSRAWRPSCRELPVPSPSLHPTGRRGPGDPVVRSKTRRSGGRSR